MSMACSAQALHIFHDGLSKPDVFANAGIDSIYYEPKFFGSTEYRQVFVTKDGVKRYDIVDSVKFNLPHLSVNKHTIDIPNDWGIINISVYSSDTDTPLLIYPEERRGEYGIFVYENRFGISKEINENAESSWDENGIYHNGIRDTIPHTEMLVFRCGNLQDSITINYTGQPLFNNYWTNGTMVFPSEEIEFTLDTNISGTTINLYNPEGNLHGVSWHINDKGNPVIHFPQNITGETKYVMFQIECKNFRNGFKQYSIKQSGQPFKHSPEEHMTALREFCDSTNFADWGKGSNWWSDEPLWKWDAVHRINRNRYGTIDDPGWFWNMNNRVASLSFNEHYADKIHGTLPKSFEVFMDDVQDENSSPLGCLRLAQCSLYGEIPYNISHHEKWSKYGWNFLQQRTWYGGGFDGDLNLKIDSIQVKDIFSNTESTVYDVLKKNKITFVLSDGDISGFGRVDDNPSVFDGIINKYLDYREKGLGLAIEIGSQNNDSLLFEQRKEYILHKQRDSNLPSSIDWVKAWGLLVNGIEDEAEPAGSMCLIDSIGNLLWYRMFDYNMPVSYYLEKMDKVLKERLGEPTGHDIYISTIYESTDYSLDGEVMTLQKATVGKGIDLVFMGDMYVDTLLVAGGQYEKDMQAAMECFFDIEPYKSLRNRFNVYTVKATSPNGHDGKQHKFNYNNELVFEYARKIPDIDMENVAITVINYNPNESGFLSGETGMWESGSSIAWIEEGGPSHIICHETGGHGIAKLLDEYVYSGYEDNHTQEGANENFREWIKTTYHDKGWGMNISATDNPNDVPWAHFLKDDRYKDEVGVYRGAWYWPEELWRPSENSIMRESNYLWFNAPSREAIYKRVMQLSEGDDWTYDYEKFVEFDLPIRDANRRSIAMAHANGGKEGPVEKRRIELRPPTIYKGSWRDAGNGDENQSYDFENFMQVNSSRVKASSGTNRQKESQKSYIMFKGERINVNKFNRKEFKARFK